MKHKVLFAQTVIAQALAEWLIARELPSPDLEGHYWVIIKEEAVALTWEDSDAEA